LAGFLVFVFRLPLMKLTTPPLAPKVIQALAKLNVHTVQDVQAMNPCRAFLLLKQLGLSVTKSVFWQLVALGSLKTVQQLAESEREYWERQLREMPPSMTDAHSLQDVLHAFFPLRSFDAEIRQG